MNLQVTKSFRKQKRKARRRAIRTQMLPSEEKPLISTFALLSVQRQRKSLETVPKDPMS